jgi:hypothetical protein
MTGIVAAQQWEPIVIVNVTVIFVAIVIVIPWPCLRRVGRAFDSAISV